MKSPGDLLTMFKKDYEDVKEVGEEERDGVVKLEKAIKSSHTETLDAFGVAFAFSISQADVDAEQQKWLVDRMRQRRCSAVLEQDSGTPLRGAEAEVPLTPWGNSFPCAWCPRVAVTHCHECGASCCVYHYTGCQMRDSYCGRPFCWLHYNWHWCTDSEGEFPSLQRRTSVRRPMQLRELPQLHLLSLWVPLQVIAGAALLWDWTPTMALCLIVFVGLSGLMRLREARSKRAGRSRFGLDAPSMVKTITATVELLSAGRKLTAVWVVGWLQEQLQPDSAAKYPITTFSEPGDSFAQWLQVAVFESGPVALWQATSSWLLPMASVVATYEIARYWVCQITCPRRNFEWQPESH